VGIPAPFLGTTPNRYYYSSRLNADQEENRMNKVAIITDSTAYLPPELITEYDIKVIPLAVIWDGDSFADGVDLTPTQFYTRLATSPTLPSTSQPPEAAFVKIFSELLEEGKDVVAILISSGISGTVNSALLAKDEIGSDRVVVVDSKTAAMAAGLHVLAAARAAAAGASLDEVKQVALKAQQQTNVVFAVDTLEFLHKGGRIGGAKRLMGSMLNIKPILEMNGGLIEPVESVRTHKRALTRLISLVEEKAAGEKPLRLAVFHSNVPDQAAALLKDAEEALSPDEVFLAELSPVIGTHVGPGTLAIAFMHGL
jgi:DegV family protein with EDD domain